MATTIQERFGEASPVSSQNGVHQRLANGLGWFSIGLGLAELAIPKQMAELVGAKRGNPTLVRAYGLREIAAGIGLLSSSNLSAWLWGRVAGDVVDLGSLGTVLGSKGTNKVRTVAATAAVAGVTALDVLCAYQLSQSSQEDQSDSKNGGRPVLKSIIIGRSPEEVYGFWRNFSNLPTFMAHLESVHTEGNRSHWTANAAAGRTVEWDAEIIDDQPNSRIAWRSLPGSDIDNSGQVRFERAPGGRGTLVTVDMTYEPPAGALGAGIAKLFGVEPSQKIQGDLRRLKQVLETGEVTRSDASIHRGMHPAQPSERAAAVSA